MRILETGPFIKVAGFFVEFKMSQVIEKKDLKVNTLKKRRDFLRVAASKKKWISPAMVLQIASRVDGEADSVQIGFTASKKVGNAVQRNKAKRLMREVTREVLGFHGRGAFDYVLIARHQILGRSFKDLIRDLKWSLKRIHDDGANKGSGSSG